MSFPFLFYGAQPAEWYGGGRLDYELRFAAAPTTADRAAIAAAVRERVPTLRELRLDAHDRWRWAEAWAALVVRTNTLDTDWTAFFDEVAALCRAIHAARRLDLVVCRSVDAAPGGGDDAWTAWSLGARPDIGPRPAWTTPPRVGHDRFAARGALLAAEAIVDADFEAARTATR